MTNWLVLSVDRLVGLVIRSVQAMGRRWPQAHEADLGLLSPCGSRSNHEDSSQHSQQGVLVASDGGPRDGVRGSMRCPESKVKMLISHFWKLSYRCIWIIQVWIYSSLEYNQEKETDWYVSGMDLPLSRLSSGRVFSQGSFPLPPAVSEQLTQASNPGCTIRV